MSDKYILNAAGEPERCNDLRVWATWMETADMARRVAIDEVGENTKVSTVFLGIDHNFGFGGSPILYETMVFGGSLDGEQERYTTREDALRGHKELLSRVGASQPLKAQ